MYNRYLDGLDSGSFVQVDGGAPQPQSRPGAGRPSQPRGGVGFSQPQNQYYSNNWQHPSQPYRSKNDLVGEVTRGLGQLLDGVKQHFSLEKFDTGDILLVLIILFLYLEDGDNLELVITLGLLLLLGLGEEEAQG